MTALNEVEILSLNTLSDFEEECENKGYDKAVAFRAIEKLARYEAECLESQALRESIVKLKEQVRLNKLKEKEKK